MALSPETTHARNPIAFRAFLGEVPGVALHTPDRHIHFADDATMTWRELTDADAPALLLCGEIALYEAQWREDGDVFAWIEHRNTEHAHVAA